MLLMCLAFLLFVGPVYARDSRYTSNWDRWDYAGDNSIQGTWEAFSPVTPHMGPKQHVKFYNQFASAIEETSGFYDVMLTFKTVDNSLRNDANVIKISLYAEPRSAGCGAYIEIRFFDYYNNMQISLYTLEGYLCDTAIVNYDAYYVALRIKMGLANYRVSGERNYVFEASMYAIFRDDGEMQLVNRYFTATPFSGDIALRNSFVHDVECNYVLGGAYADWECTSTIYDVGIRPDIMLEDCCVQIYDIVFVTSNFNQRILGPKYWNENAYKADVNCDGWVSIYDVTYLTGLFDKCW